VEKINQPYAVKAGEVGQAGGEFLVQNAVANRVAGAARLDWRAGCLLELRVDDAMGVSRISGGAVTLLVVDITMLIKKTPCESAPATPPGRRAAARTRQSH